MKTGSLDRRGLILGVSALSVLAVLPIATPARAQQPVVEVVKSPTCGCCTSWVEHMEAAGFRMSVTDAPQGLLQETKVRLGITPETASCHTATVDGYVVEGHVPAEDVRRLLEERPEARGLAVPGMPLGSPGMEVSDVRDPYDVLLIREDGSTEVFASHNRP